MRHADRLDEFGAGNGRRASTVHNDAGILHLLARQIKRFDQAGGCNNGGAMLVIMHDGNVHPLFERLFDDEAFRGGNIF